MRLAVRAWRVLEMCFVLPGKGPGERELTLADGSLDTFTVGHLEYSSVRRSLVVRSLLPAECNHLQQTLVVSNM